MEQVFTNDNRDIKALVQKEICTELKGSKPSLKSRLHSAYKLIHKIKFSSHESKGKS